MKLISFVLVLVISISLFSFIPSNDENEELAFQITALFRAYRKAIAVNKEAIQNPAHYFKDKAKRVEELKVTATKFYEEMTGKTFPNDKKTQRGKVRYLLEKAVRKVIYNIADGKYDLKWKGENTYVKKWDGKLLPARFANNVANTFNKLTNLKVKIKLTTSEKLLVNRTNKPDKWESEIIDKFLINTTNKDFVTKSKSSGKYFRFILPEYYGSGCIGCHGTNKGQEGYDIHPSKIKRNLNDFAGAISVSFQN